MYWPKEGTETYGVIQVKLVKEDVMATYTVRTLQIRHLRVKNLFIDYLKIILKIGLDQEEEGDYGGENSLPIPLHQLARPRNSRPSPSSLVFRKKIRVG